jgi:aryl-alcohol dehydrogenase-like predicted oxidoreductase|tara:strand:- start:158 stop:1003 length:846 start_codon:yes stop_codon:yes gene_type:complete
LKKKLIIGTAKFGFPYGIGKKRIRIKKKEVFKILNFARLNGIKTLDTAINYGDCEKILGDYGIKKWRVITKLPTIKDIKQVDRLVVRSIENLKINQIDTLLFHDTKQMLSREGEKIFKKILDLKKQGLIKKIGFSVYFPNEVKKILRNYKFQVIQCPFNIIDRRMVNEGIFSLLKRNNIEIHARSIFLKGLLLLNKNQMPKKFKKWRHLWNNLHNFLNSKNRLPSEVCANFALSNRMIDKIVVGFDDKNQLDNFLSIKKEKIFFPKNIQSSDISLLNPSNW